MPRPSRLRLLATLAVGAVVAFSGCSQLLVERADPQMERGSVDRNTVKVDSVDVDPIMRGTIAAETGLNGFNDTPVRGYGLVVGLRGTGSRTMPADVRAYMMAELGRRGYGSGKPGASQLTPSQMLNDPNTAVVIVEGLIPPGAPKGTTFDVRVYTAPGTSTTSLEGGRLLATSLRPGPLFTGSRQPFALAEASGPIVINPFIEPNSTRQDAISRTTGRILDAGKVSKDMPLRLRLFTPSHARAETIQNSINSVFPREPRQRNETARGRSGDAIDLTVPPSYARKTGEFAELVRHTPLSVDNPEQSAMAIRRSLLANPGAAGAASWRWQALGKKALPMIQDLYTYPEEQPRLAALDAGAKLNDMLAVPHLIQMAKSSTSLTYRIEAVRLLGRMGTNPEIEMGLRELLNDKELDVRLAAFEALDKRGDPRIVSIDIGTKFTLNIVPSSYPLIYVSQSGKPRIVIFDEQLEVSRPLTVVAWETRLIMKADEGDEYLQIYYRETPETPAVVDRVRPRLLEFISYLGRRPSVERPESGLGFSYSETISALHELWRSGYIKADFKAEQDRLQAELLRAVQSEEDTYRPEFAEDMPEGALDSESAPAGTLSEISASRSDLQSISRPGVDASKPRKDTVPR
jgi:hypothetical protein